MPVRLYGYFGLTVSDAANTFFAKSPMVHGLPFDMRLGCSQDTLNAFQEARDIMSGDIQAYPYSSIGEMHLAMEAMPDDEDA